MILHYFKKKEKPEEILAKNYYNLILKKSNLILNKSSFFTDKNYNTSFEIVTILIIIFIKLNIKNKNQNYKKINEILVSTFISDLDESLRSKGIGDMSIGKYVKKYVKKFYFRLSKFPENLDFRTDEEFINYLNKVEIIQNNHYQQAIDKFSIVVDDISKIILKQ